MRAYAIFLQLLGLMLTVGALFALFYMRLVHRLTYAGDYQSYWLALGAGLLGVVLIAVGKLGRLRQAAREKAERILAAQEIEPAPLAPEPSAPVTAAAVPAAAMPPVSEPGMAQNALNRVPGVPMLCKLWHSPSIQSSTISADFRDDQKAARLIALRNNRGFKLDEQELPRRFIDTGEDGPPPSQPVEAAGPHILYSHALIEQMFEADLGQTRFFAIEITDPEGAARPGGYSLANIANIKDSLVEDESQNLERLPMTARVKERMSAARQAERERSRRVGFSTGAGDVVLSADCLDGPDIWIEKRLHDGVFISARLAEQLEAAGLLAALCPVPCRVEGAALQSGPATDPEAQSAPQAFDVPMVCNLMHNPEIATGCIGADMQEDRRAALKRAIRNARGLPLDREDFPEMTICPLEGSPPRAPVAEAGRRILLREDVIGVLSGHDIGALRLFPTQLLSPGKPAAHIPYGYVNWANRKDSLLETQSGNLDMAALAANADAAAKARHKRLRKLGGPVADGDVALSPAALDGPDIWVEKRLHDAVLISSRLARALNDAGLLEAFAPVRCRIVGEAAKMPDQLAS